MLRVICFTVCLVLFAGRTSALAEDPELEAVRNLVWSWAAALNTGDPGQVAAMYGPDSVLLPTVSNDVRYTDAERRDYFEKFLKNKPNLTDIVENYVRFLDDDKSAAANSGVYIFELTDPTSGTKSLVPARFSFVYKKDNATGNWSISEHHSSQMPEPEPVDEAEIAALFDAWNAALQTGDPQKVADMYAADSVLLPTVWDGPLDTREKKVEYFTTFLKKKPFGTINQSIIRILDNAKTNAINSGIYTFDLTAEDGTMSKVGARYTYVYKKQADGSWKIVEHHSSVLPVGDAVAPPPAPTELDVVKQLIWEWAAALQTGDPNAVAAKYAADGVLLPTVSNDVRYNATEKINYFESFLKNKPNLTEIVENYVRFIDDSDKDVAANSGIYIFELTDPATGAKTLVPARFSFVYEKDANGAWLITEHHSSMMPEPEPVDEAEIAALFDAWNAALQTGDPLKVADMYAEDSVLLPTVWDGPLDTRQEKVDYFTTFLKKKPFGTINQSIIRILDNAKTNAINSGIYTFDLTAEDGTVSKVGARYTYVYKKQADGTWKIVEHHSSVLPVGDAVAPQPAVDAPAQSAGRKLLAL